MPIVTYNDIVTILGFCSILMLFPKPVPYFPMFAAFLGIYTGVNGSIVDASFVGMVAGLFFGVPYMLIAIMMRFGDK